ncbi:MAG: hypothetical protein QOC72_3172 [Methylobacteriaceae bacterium]|jgi:DNA-binding NarL/FixJ family response regulator|nr:hypothetical protein [Methylobacteriaceae bacterium]
MPFGSSTSANPETIAAIAQTLENIIEGLERTATGCRTLKSLLPDPERKMAPNLDPKDPANKFEVGGLMKLTPRGVDVCNHLFEIGLSRYAVARAMGISFGAANHRFQTWKKRGGVEKRSSG